jgi:hypothetical protein
MALGVRVRVRVLWLWLALEVELRRLALQERTLRRLTWRVCGIVLAPSSLAVSGLLACGLVVCDLFPGSRFVHRLPVCVPFTGALAVYGLCARSPPFGRPSSGGLFPNLPLGGHCSSPRPFAQLLRCVCLALRLILATLVPGGF